MRGAMRTLIALCVLGLSAACGPTIGDACTLPAECGTGASCINRDFTPGGYCSLACTFGNNATCPRGSVCVKDALGKGAAGCMRTCRQATDCRSSAYICQFAKDSTSTVCIGPAGI